MSLTYYKPSNISYAKMCMWLDNAVTDYKFSDEETAYKYMYLVYQMFAKKYKWFKKETDFDLYGIYCAEHMFLRMVDKTKEPIKSTLRYIKSTAIPYKVAYQNEFFYKDTTTDSLDALCEECYDSGLTLHRYIQDECDRTNTVDYLQYIGNISKSIKKYVEEKTIYKDREEFTNIYISVMLSYLDSITLTNMAVRNMRSRTVLTQNKPEFLAKQYRKEQRNDVILYHLPESMEDYISVLLKEIKALVVKDLSYLLQTNMPETATSMNLLLSSVERIGNNGYEDGFYDN